MIRTVTGLLYARACTGALLAAAHGFTMKFGLAAGCLVLLACSSSDPPAPAPADAGAEAGTCDGSPCGEAGTGTGSEEAAVDEFSLGATCTSESDCSEGEACVSYVKAVPSFKRARCVASTSKCDALFCPTGSTCSVFAGNDPQEATCAR